MRTHTQIHYRTIHIYTRFLFCIIGSGDIVSCNSKLILGLVWTLILHYQISVGFGIDEKKRGNASAKQIMIEYVQVSISCVLYQNILMCIYKHG